MPVSIDQVVPWGRTLAEYQAMFSLSPADLRRRILGCGDGPASFNAELTARGRTVVSVDPLYAVPGAAIERRVQETFTMMMDQVRRNANDFVWTHVPSIAELGRRRLGAMRRFVSDYASGIAEGRYVEGAVPDLPFADDTFDLALSSHFLFLYSEQFDLGFHLDALRELLRVAAEVRAFPLLQLGGAASPHVPEVVETMHSEGVRATVEPVPYEFMRGGDHMLRLHREAMPVADGC